MIHAERSEVIFIGGRSGVGKSSVALEMLNQLTEADVKHAVIEGDNLDQAHPAPWRTGLHLAELNLAAMWRNYREAGYRRVIYTNTVSVLETETLSEAMGDDVHVTAVLLTASDDTARARLSRREIGSALDSHVERSNHAAHNLEMRATDAVHRISTDGRTVADIASEIIGLTGWLDLASVRETQFTNDRRDAIPATLPEPTDGPRERIERDEPKMLGDRCRHSNAAVLGE